MVQEGLKGRDKLTEQNGYMFHFVDDCVQHLISDVLNLIRTCFLLYPFEDGIFVGNISFVVLWDSFLVKDEFEMTFAAFNFLMAINLNEFYFEFLEVVVNVFK